MGVGEGGYPGTGTLGKSLQEDEPALSSGPGVWDPWGLRGGGVGTARERGPGLLSRQRWADVQPSQLEEVVWAAPPVLPGSGARLHPGSRCSLRAAQGPLGTHTCAMSGAASPSLHSVWDSD